MAIFDFWKKQSRSGETFTQSSERFYEFVNLASGGGTAVTLQSALGVPAVWSAVNFLSATLAGLPLHVYEKTADGRKKVKGKLAAALHGAANDEMSSFAWRKYIFECVFTGGRALTYIERTPSGVVNLWPLEPSKVSIKRAAGGTTYTYKDGRRTITYSASEIIDLPFMLREDMLSHRGPISTCKKAIGLAIAAQEYGTRFFDHGGVPPFVVTGKAFISGGAVKRASDDVSAAIKKAAEEGRHALVMPEGLEVKELGTDPEKTQLVELQRFCIEQIARVYSLPPVFLQDLTHGTFSNTEQQDLHFVKHTLKRWAEQFEQELNLKLFGRNAKRYVELNLDGLLRGDFKTRMDGYATGIQNAILTPNEVRARENLPAQDNADELMVQGATVPVSSQSKQD